jgi:hypothetical protein
MTWLRWIVDHAAGRATVRPIGSGRSAALLSPRPAKTASFKAGTFWLEARFTGGR